MSLGNVIDTSPSPDKSGPLIVGQSWAIEGQLAAVGVTKTLTVPQLVKVQNGYGTLSVADQANAAQLPRSGYFYVSYTNNDQLKQVRFVWDENAAGSVLERYECAASYNGGAILTGVLTLQRQNDTAVARGTCTATPTNPPKAPPAP